jgi:3-methyl-2-oxobutanoate hydroxymethyltransferase
MAALTILDIAAMKRESRKISMVTCYDAWSARILGRSEVDCLLVGDSAAMVMHGFPSTVHATVPMMRAHVEAVTRGSAGAKLIVGDLPFLSYRQGAERALEAVGELMRAGAHAVKLEGVWGHEDVVERTVGSGVPVMGHIGLTPQSIHGLGGFRVQGRDAETAEDLMAQARKLEELGCFALVLECVPSAVAKAITAGIRIPTIGIGAGPSTDGQVLVLQDLLGMDSAFKPRFLRSYLEGEPTLRGSVDRFHRDVQSGAFPTEKESYS